MHKIADLKIKMQEKEPNVHLHGVEGEAVV
jgi:hypothetical protein